MIHLYSLDINLVSMLKRLNELRPDSIVNTVVQCTIYNVHCILYNIHTVQCTMYIQSCTTNKGDIMAEGILKIAPLECLLV